MLEQLRGLRNQIDALQTEMRADFQELKHRLTGVGIGMAGQRRDGIGTQEDVYRQHAAIDRINERIPRIEKRLELAGWLKPSAATGYGTGAERLPPGGTTHSAPPTRQARHAPSNF